MDIDAIVLAAGESRRMGSSKQMLEVSGVPMLRRTVRIIRESGIARNILVVLGADAAAHLEVLSEEPVRTVFNQNWKSGMGSSVKCGLDHLDRADWPDGLLITVCDQPLLTTDVLRNLADAASPEGLVVSTYGDGAIGTPVVAGRRLLDSLHDMPDDAGLRTFFPRWEKKITRIAFPGGEVDLDTPEDYRKFLQGPQAS